MTTRKELVALGSQHLLTGGVKQLMTAIAEAKNEMDLATFQLLTRSESADFAKKQENYEAVGSFAEEAARYERGAAKMQTSLFTLACVLQNAGINIDF